MIRRYYKWLLLIIPGLPVIIAWDGFIVPAGTNSSDILISHFPNLLLLQRSLGTGEGIPLWSPAILSGFPLAANPLSSLWYPPAWISLFFPISLGINLVMALHIILGCAGFYYFLRQYGLEKETALLGCLFFGLLPAGYSHVIAGHFTWVCASAWFPWLLALSISIDGNCWKRTILTAIFLGLMLLADLRFSVYAVVIWIVFVGFSCLKRHINAERLYGLRQITFVLVSGLLALGLSAAVWVPLLEYTKLSTRSLMKATDSFYLSLPPVQLTGLVVPGHPSTVEWIMYPGSVIFLLFIVAFSFLRKNDNLKLWFLIALCSLFWALGENITWNKNLISFPMLDMLRVPSRGVYFLSIALLMMALLTMDWLLRSNPKKAVFLRLGTIGMAALALLIQGFVALANPEKNLFIIIHMACWVVTAVIVLLYSYKKVTTVIFLSALGIFGVLDIGFADLRLLDTRPYKDALSDEKLFGDVLLQKGGDFRVFSPSYSIPQHTAAYNKLELADGIDPMQLISYSNFIRESISSPMGGYSVTLPEFKNGKPETDNKGITPSASKLALLNVQYMASAFPIDEAGWVIEEFSGGGFLYRNELALGWAWMEPAPGSGIKDYVSVNQVNRRNNQIQIQANGPGFLHLAEIDYPGWEATVDGVPVSIHTAYGILRAVELTEGPHLVTISFRPIRVYSGILISLVTIAICFFAWNNKRLYG